MPPVISPILTPGEKRIMDVLWRRGSGSVHEVQANLPHHTKLAYNTVLSMLRTMTDKGYVNYQKDGRAFTYFPAISEGEARNQAIKTLISRFFGESPRDFAQHLVQESEFDRGTLDVLKDEIMSAEKAKRNE